MSVCLNPDIASILLVTKQNYQCDDWLRQQPKPMILILNLWKYIRPWQIYHIAKQTDPFSKNVWPAYIGGWWKHCPTLLLLLLSLPCEKFYILLYEWYLQQYWMCYHKCGKSFKVCPNCLSDSKWMLCQSLFLFAIVVSRFDCKMTQIAQLSSLMSSQLFHL